MGTDPLAAVPMQNALNLENCSEVTRVGVQTPPTFEPHDPQSFPPGLPVVVVSHGENSVHWPVTEKLRMILSYQALPFAHVRSKVRMVVKYPGTLSEFAVPGI